MTNKAPSTITLFFIISSIFALVLSLPQLANAQSEISLRVDPQGNVGIGTNTPGGLLGLKNNLVYLDVDKNNNLTFTDANNSAVTLSQLVGGIVINKPNFTNPLARWSSGDNGAIYYNRGNVGIGTSAPAALLDISGSESSIPALNISASTNASGVYGATIRQLSQNQNTLLVENSSAGGNGGALVVNSVKSTGNIFDVQDNGSSVFVVKDGGSVGIGTNSPASNTKLDVAGGIQAKNDLIARDGNTSSALQLRSDSYGDAYISNMNNFVGNGTTANNMLRIVGQKGIELHYGDAGAYGTLAMVVNSSGNVGIGTDSPGSYKLNVNGSAAKPGGGSWSNSSDRRLKNILGNYEKGLEAISKLRPVKFQYKKGNPRGLPSDESYIGFIAQEVQKVFPEAVSPDKDGYLDFNMHSINVAVVNALGELYSENKAKDKAIAELKAENQALKAAVCDINPGAGICAK